MKQPDEQFPIAADFGKVIAENETIDGAASSVTAVDSSGNNATNVVLVSNSMTVDGTKIIITVTGGASGERYKITFRCHTTANNIYELDVLMIVNAL